MFFAIPKPARSFVKQYMAYYIHIVCLFVYVHSTAWGLPTKPWNVLSFFTWTLLHRTQVCQHQDYELAFTPNHDVRKQQKHRDNFNGNNPLSPKSKWPFFCNLFVLDIIFFALNNWSHSIISHLSAKVLFKTATKWR